MGKSVVAQLVAFGLIMEKLLDPERIGGLRVTILAPRQLVVSEAGGGKDDSQWMQHRLELWDELHRALSAKLHDGTATTKTVGMDWVARERKRKRSERQIRVMSLSVLVRKPREDGWATDAVQDFEHIAGSEVVVLDESHNLRNGGSAQVRLARFLLSLPVPGEDWPVFLRLGGKPKRLNKAPEQDPYARRFG